MRKSPCSLDGAVDFSNHQFLQQTGRGQDTESHDPTAETSRYAHAGTDSGGRLGVRFSQLGFQPGVFRTSATGTVTNTRYHRHNLYLGTGPNWTTCKRTSKPSMVAPVCRFVSLKGTICSSVSVQ